MSASEATSVRYGGDPAVFLPGTVARVFRAEHHGQNRMDV